MSTHTTTTAITYTTADTGRILTHTMLAGVATAAGAPTGADPLAWVNDHADGVTVERCTATTFAVVARPVRTFRPGWGWTA